MTCVIDIRATRLPGVAYSIGGGPILLLLVPDPPRGTTVLCRSRLSLVFLMKCVELELYVLRLVDSSRRG